MTRRASILAAIVLCVCVIADAEAGKYYIDFTAGNDSTGVGSNKYPWKTLANVDTVLEAGNTIYFKRGEVWRLTGMPGTSHAGDDYHRDYWYMNAKGSPSPEPPITITDYGSSGDPPMLTTLQLWDSEWEAAGGSVWRHTGVTKSALRCFIDGVGQKRAFDLGSLGADDTVWYYDVTDTLGCLYLYSVDSPNGRCIETLPGPVDVSGDPTSHCVIAIDKSDNIVIENVALHGGATTALHYGHRGEGFEVRNCDIRYTGKSGITFKGLDDTLGFRNITIEDNVVDFALDSLEIQQPDVNGSTAYFPNTSSSDGICFVDHATNAVIARNVVKDFSHSQIQLLGRNGDLEDGVTGITIEANEMSCPHTIHGRGWCVIGVEDRCTDIVVRANYVHDTAAANHCRGSFNKYYGNIIVNVRRSEDDGSDDAIQLNASPGDYVNTQSELVAYATVCHDNDVFNNTIVAADGAGIIVGHSCGSYEGAECDSTNHVKDNLIANNIVVDCGDLTGRYQLEVIENDNYAYGIYDNTFANNCLYRADKDSVILYRGVPYLVADADAAALADTFLNTIDDDPRFWDYSGGNYELQRDSPCKWTGYELDGDYLDFNGDLFHDPPSRGALEAHRDSPGDDDSSDISSSKIRLMAHPNPFGPETALRFTLPTSGPIRLTVHDPAGRLVTTVAEGHCTAGEREMKWDGSNATGQQLPSGVYFARLIAPGGTAFRKLILVR